MGVYINMEMPKDGCHHTICIYADGTVSTGGQVYMAVPVPPHGRLIDEDVLKMEIDKQINKWKPLPVYAYEVLENVPTVIAASKEET